MNSMNLKWERYFIMLLQETGVENRIYICNKNCKEVGYSAENFHGKTWKSKVQKYNPYFVCKKQTKLFQCMILMLLPGNLNRKEN